MEKIEDYILRSKAERQTHLRLDEACDERGGFSSYCKALLAYHLDTSIPSGRYVQVCHACHNAKCSNVAHLYWGTYKDNKADAIANGAPRSPYHARLRKLGKEEADRLNARPGNRNGKGNAGNALSETHKANISQNLTGRKNANAGRKPASDPDQLLDAVVKLGFKGAAEKLQIDIDVLRHRYYRVKKKQ